MKMQRQIRLQRKAYRKLREMPESEASYTPRHLYRRGEQPDWKSFEMLDTKE